jgi:hypothetical protein
MKRILSSVLCLYLLMQTGQGQVIENSGMRILFRGLVMDASSLSPVANSQIFINKSFSAVSDSDGTFSFYVNKYDTIIFRSLGYRPTMLFVSDTLTGREFLTGIYMSTDTLSIGEVVIVPKFTNLKSEILNTRTITSPEIENAKYNVAISAYQGRNSRNLLGDPANNYELLRQKQKIDAFEKGGIPSDRIVGLSPFMLLPAAYLLIHGLPEKHSPFKPQLTDQEVDEIHKKYLETLGSRREVK